MFYTYVLKSLKNGTLYVGSTNDLKQRVDEHNRGIGGDYTRKIRPFQLVFYEAFLAKKMQRNKSGFTSRVMEGKFWQRR